MISRITSCGGGGSDVDEGLEGVQHVRETQNTQLGKIEEQGPSQPQQAAEVEDDKMVCTEESVRVQTVGNHRQIGKAGDFEDVVSETLMPSVGISFKDCGNSCPLASISD